MSIPALVLWLKQMQMMHSVDHIHVDVRAHSPGRRCPCWRSGRSSGTWVCCTCSYLEQPGACEQRSQSFPLKRKHALINPQRCNSEAVRDEMTVTGALTSPPPEFDLIPLEVGLVFHYFNKTLKKDMHWFSNRKLNGAKTTVNPLNLFLSSCCLHC